MNNYQQHLEEEMAYLERTLALIRKEIEAGTEALVGRKSRLIASRRDMWEESAHFVSDFEKLTEVNQHLAEVSNQTINYAETLKRTEKYKRMIGTPYFGRFDFVEDGSDYREKIYIGLHNVMDSKTHNIFVYDWRAPISSIFYRYEPGKASYDAPIGAILGEVLLKRQHKIQNSELKYFFDCSIQINDEILQEVLSHNASDKMKSIVETIQKEQDIIIRDIDNELLIVQGVAGSGKTSIAMHRIAFLLYEGLHSNISSNNILVISPNAVFSKYISSVLPELGEENIEQTTFDDIVANALGDRMALESRNMQLESLIASRNQELCGVDVRRQSIEFKGSRVFAKILDRLIRYYERNMIEFEDVYYDGKIIETRQQLKNLFLNHIIGTPMAKRLKRIERMILEKIHPLQRKRLERIEKIVQKSDGHELEIKSFSRLLSMKETKVLIARLHRFTEVDYMHLYEILFNDSELLFNLARGLELPKDIKQIISATRQMFKDNQLHYEDCAPLLYLKLRIEGSELFSEIRQVVIDEAQDYYPLQYEVFKLLFKDARYTVLGDIHQAVEKDVDIPLYDSVAEIFDKRKSVKLTLNKSYRSSYEINAFTQRLLKKKQEFISFERHEAEPIVVFKDSLEMIDRAIAHDVAHYLEHGYESIAVICKTQAEAEKIYTRLRELTSIKLIDTRNGEVGKGGLVIPSYMAKGLEFDVVIVYNANRENYLDEFDRKLLYIACTRALHRLVVYYTGEISPFICL